MNKTWLLGNIKLLLAAFVVIIFSAFDSSLKSRKVLNGFAQGTTWQIIYYAPNNSITKAQIDSIFTILDQSMSLYKTNSLINQFNKSDKGIEIDNHFGKVIKRALMIHKHTSGAFDITVKPLVQAWGFGVTKTDNEPNPNKIKDLLSCTGSDKLVLKKNRLEKSKSCVEIDLNGIAQGYTIDVIAKFLEGNGIDNYLVELGGELKAKGKKNDGQPFQVGIQLPNEELQSYQKVIYLDNGAITTSGNYRNFKINGKKKISHLIDAKSGYPIENEMISVSVWAKDAITADGYDNAFMSMGLRKSMAFLKKKSGLEAYFIYIDKKGNVADTATSGFRKLFKKQAELNKNEQKEVHKTE